ncbi:hypothetical protein SAMN06265350_101126 [Solitalea koreensis]|uniref:Uncharacterized protein n=2 Tax=Solitalea koreensis TaxID=543615 RepID=A0A521AFY2_9SPHI|nr:hypothetical protein SAMN06265350_101126 [Solitalea koreensis]
MNEDDLMQFNSEVLSRWKAAGYKKIIMTQFPSDDPINDLGEESLYYLYPSKEDFDATLDHAATIPFEQRKAVFVIDAKEVEEMANGIAFDIFYIKEP